MSHKEYNWKRFWCQIGGVLDLSDGGFLYDPESEYGKYLNPNINSMEEIMEYPCLILLGEPGIGKSVEIGNAIKSTKQKLNLDESQISYINLNQFTSETRLIESIFHNQNLINSQKTQYPYFIFLDSLDECKLRIDTISQILSEEFNKCYYKNLYLRITCRTAEWPSSLEDNLKQIWDESDFHVYELTPLLKKDVLSAINGNNLDAKIFMDEIYQKEVQPFSMKPVTLNFLINTYLKYNSLPNTRKGIFEQGIKILIEEYNPSRRESRLSEHFNINQKMAAAQRIAALMILTNRNSIYLGNNHLEINSDDILIEDFNGGIEMIGDIKIEITERLISDVIATGLFTAKDRNRMGWAHQTYSEFLTANFLVNNKFSEEQILDFVSIKSSNRQNIVPQLNETVGWVVTLQPILFNKILEMDSEILLKSDVTLQDNEDKERLVSVLLNLFDGQKLFDRNYSLAGYYHKLFHPKLFYQLRPFIVDKAKCWNVRQQAIAIAEKCKLLQLQEDLLTIFFNKEDSLEVRKYAGRGLSKLADENYIIRMKELLFSDNTYDIDDDLKAICLFKLWPKFMSANELFNILTKPTCPNYFGDYKRFLFDDPIKDLEIEDLPIALEWIIKQDSLENFEQREINDIIDSIMFLGWTNLDKTPIIDLYTKVIRHLRNNHRSIVSGKDSNNFEKLFYNQDSKRRLLINKIVYSFDGPIKDIRYMYIIGGMRLALPKDFSWLLRKAFLEKDDRNKRILLNLSKCCFDFNNISDITLLIDLSEKDETVFEEFGYLLNPIELNSQEALELKSLLSEEKELNNFTEENVSFRISWLKNINKLLAGLKNNDLASYWVLLIELAKDPDQKEPYFEYQSDLTISPGWKYLSENDKQLIIDMTKEYLLNIDTKSNEWIDDNIINRPAIAGYKGIRLLYKYAPEFIKYLPTNIWQRWIPTILSYPVYYSWEDHSYHTKVVADVYLSFPKDVLVIFQRLLEKECRRDEQIFITREFEECWDDEISKIIFKKINDKNLFLNCFSSLVKDLLKNNYLPIEQFLYEIIRSPIPDNEIEYKKFILSCKFLICYKGKYWREIWSLLIINKEFGKELIVELANARRYEGDFLSKLDEFEVANLFIWIKENFPEKDYRREVSTFSFCREDEVFSFSNEIISYITNKGNDNSKSAIIYIKEKLPSLDWLNVALYDAIIISRVKNWLPPTPKEILIILGNKRKKFISNEIELLEIIIESLLRLEFEMHGETPSVKFLWESNETFPKDENSLSDFVKIHLNKDLNNIIVNREVEIRPRRGLIKGEETDILVQTFSKNSLGEITDKLSVIIETKGCWHSELSTAMENQLYERYLKNNKCKVGLYLVGWFNCESWSKDDHRYSKSPKYDIDEAKNIFEKQAKSLSKEECFINSFVLDCRIS